MFQTELRFFNQNPKQFRTDTAFFGWGTEAKVTN